MTATATISRILIFASAETAADTAAVLAAVAGTDASSRNFRIGTVTVEVVQGAVALPAALELALTDAAFEAAISRLIAAAAWPFALAEDGCGASVTLPGLRLVLRRA